MDLTQIWHSRKYDTRQYLRESNDLRGISSRLNEVYHGHRATLNALIMKFMRYLTESALPYLRYQNHVNMGFAADRPESIEIESTLSHPGSDNDSSWADVQGSFFDDHYLPQSGSKQTGMKFSYRQEAQPSGGRPSSIKKRYLPPERDHSPQGEGQGATRREPPDHFWKETLSKEYLTRKLRLREDELEDLRECLATGQYSSTGRPLAKSARKALKERKKEVKEAILDLENELEWIRRKDKLSKDNLGPAKGSKTHSDSHYHPTSKKTKSDDRRVTIDAPIMENQERYSYIFSDSPEGVKPSQGSRGRNDSPERPWRQPDTTWPSSTPRVTSGAWPNVHDLSMNFQAEARRQYVAPGGHGDPDHDSDDGPRRRRRDQDPDDRQDRGRRDQDDRRDRDYRNQDDHHEQDHRCRGDHRHDRDDRHGRDHSERDRQDRGGRRHDRRGHENDSDESPHRPDRRDG